MTCYYEILGQQHVECRKNEKKQQTLHDVAKTDENLGDQNVEKNEL